MTDEARREEGNGRYDVSSENGWDAAAGIELELA
jgi:hypothetical protein